MKHKLKSSFKIKETTASSEQIDNTPSPLSIIVGIGCFVLLLMGMIFGLFYFLLDPVVETISRTKLGTYETTQSCNAGPGFCGGCGFNISGSYNCTPTLKRSCDGTQRVLKDKYTVVQRHESGDVTTTYDYGPTLKILSKCY